LVVFAIEVLNHQIEKVVADRRSERANDSRSSLADRRSTLVATTKRERPRRQILAGQNTGGSEIDASEIMVSAET